MSVLHSLAGFVTKKGILNEPWTLGLVLLGLFLSVVTAFLVVSGQWIIAFGVILAVPAIILLVRYPLLALIIWLLLTPFLISTDGGLLRRVYWVIHRLLPLAIIGVIVIGSMLGIQKRKLPKIGWPELAMAGYLIVTVLSILYLNNDVKPTLIVFYDRIVVPMCLYLIIRLLNPNENDLKLVLLALMFIVISQSIIGVLSWIAPQVLPSYWLNRVGTRTTGSLRAYSVFTSTLAFCGLFLLHSGLNQGSKVRRFWYIGLFSLSVFMIFFSFSRGSWLAGVFVMLGLIYLYPRFLMRYGLVAILAVALIVSAGLLSYYLDYAGERFYSEQSEDSALSRLPVMYASYKMFEEKPLSGWGYGNFDEFDRQFQKRVAGFSPEKDHASHNVYLTLLAEQGLVGFSLFLFPLFWWLIQTVKVWPQLPTRGLVSRNLVFILWLVILFHVVVNNFSNMRIVFGLGMWWITLGLIASIVHSNLKTSTSSGSPPPGM